MKEILLKLRDKLANQGLSVEAGIVTDLAEDPWLLECVATAGELSPDAGTEQKWNVGIQLYHHIFGC